MLEIVLNIITLIALIVIAVCQIKQAFFPIIYPDLDSYKPGVEVPKDTEVDESNPLYEMIMNAYDKANTLQTPSAFIQKIIDEPEDTGVEIITDKEEAEGY
jgi:hypothetical protein